MTWLEKWEPEDNRFRETEGKKIAWRTVTIKKTASCCANDVIAIVRFAKKIK